VKDSLRWAFTLARWASNALNKSKNHSLRVWKANLPSEVAFWDKWIENKGGMYSNDFKKCIDPDLELQPEISLFVTSEQTKLLDVGAGPLTVLGKKWKGRKLNITAVDPLGDEYARLLKKYNVTPIVQTQQLCAEQLTEMFQPNFFDISHAANCLDHSYDPVLAIEQMLMVTREGGVVILRHEFNEGSNELYRGLHQWNFNERNGDFVVSAPARPETNISRLLADRAVVSISRRPEINYMDVTMIKATKGAKNSDFAGAGLNRESRD
jgi:SAM-dependent methyltransferase